MKLNEMITEATKQDYVGCDANSILAHAQTTMTVRPRRSGIKKIILIAAAICLVVGSISAATLFSGFETAFGHKIDTGHVEVLSSSTDNPDVIWNIAETWFDEYNLHIGGTVITPQPLDVSGDHRVMCYYKIPGEEEHHLMPGYIFASGENESAFLVSGGTVGHGDGTFTRTGFNEEKITLELKFCMLYDYALVPKIDGESYFIEDYITIPGEWTYTVDLESRDEQVLRWNGRQESQAPASSEAVVTAVAINAFSMEITGENLTYSYNTTEGRRETEIGVWLKMKDGTYLDKEAGNFANTENRVEYRKNTGEIIIYCFENPIDPNEVESLILFADWLTIPSSGEDHLIRDGFEYYPSTEAEENRLEGWIPVMEIPLG
ncbi:MAG: hypothetical protein E7604_14775 [Ruminococcaceae bacterium]|nr:hypothetical protein [Oscillospiraceae bacterium]